MKLRSSTAPTIEWAKRENNFHETQTTFKRQSSVSNGKRMNRIQLYIV